MQRRVRVEGHKLLTDGRLTLGLSPSLDPATPQRQITNHMPNLMVLIGCFLTALISIGGAVAMFEYTFSGIEGARFAMCFFVSSCLAILGLTTGAGTIGAFFDWGEKFLQSLEERYTGRQ